MSEGFEDKVKEGGKEGWKEEREGGREEGRQAGREGGREKGGREGDGREGGRREEGGRKDGVIEQMKAYHSQSLEEACTSVMTNVISSLLKPRSCTTDAGSLPGGFLYKGHKIWS